MQCVRTWEGAHSFPNWCGAGCLLGRMYVYIGLTHYRTRSTLTRYDIYIYIHYNIWCGENHCMSCFDLLLQQQQRYVHDRWKQKTESDDDERTGDDDVSIDRSNAPSEQSCKAGCVVRMIWNTPRHAHRCLKIPTAQRTHASHSRDSTSPTRKR